MHSQRSTAENDAPDIIELGLVDYDETFARMREYVALHEPGAPGREQLWLLEHPPVYTLGLAGKPEHILDAGSVPVMQSDRGGQVTYHGPGQAVVYTMIDLKHRGIGLRSYVSLLEQAIMAYLARFEVHGTRREKAPGVYVNDAKIAALGLRFKNGMTYHGVSLNAAMDLEPFTRINPCGYKGLEVTQLKDVGVTLSAKDAAIGLATEIINELNAHQRERANRQDVAVTG